MLRLFRLLAPAVLGLGLLIVAQAQSPAPCTAYVSVVHTVSGQQFVGPTKAQLSWIKSHADKGKYAGLCYWGPLLPMALKAAKTLRSVWRVLPGQQTKQQGLPTYLLSWGSYTQRETMAAHGAFNNASGYAVDTQHRNALRASAAVYYESSGTLHLLMQTAGLHAKYDCGFGSALCHPADGPAIKWGMDYLAKLLNAQ